MKSVKSKSSIKCQILAITLLYWSPGSGPNIVGHIQWWWASDGISWSMISWKVLIHATHSASSIRSSWLYLDKPEWHRCKKPTQPQCGQGGQSFIFRNCVSLGMIRIRLLCSEPSLARISVDEWISHDLYGHVKMYANIFTRIVISLAFVCICWNPATPLQWMCWYSFS